MKSKIVCNFEEWLKYQKGFYGIKKKDFKRTDTGIYQDERIQLLWSAYFDGYMMAKTDDWSNKK